MFVIVIELLWLSIKAKPHGKFVKYLLAYLGRIFQLSLELLNSDSKCYHFSVVFFLVFFNVFNAMLYIMLHKSFFGCHCLREGDLVCIIS